MNINSIALAAVALAAVTTATSTLAADLGGTPRRPFDPRPVTPVLDIERWTGFYLGGTLGGSFGDSTIAGAFADTSFDTRGWAGTLLAGYNWHSGPLVFGIETDVGIGGVGGSITTGGLTYGVDQNIFGSFRGRLGILLTPALLAYATGGFAWSMADIGFRGLDQGRETLKGYQLGAGAEYRFERNWSMRLEYVYTDFGDVTLTHAGLTNRVETDYHTVRAGLTFRF